LSSGTFRAKGTEVPLNGNPVFLVTLVALIAMVLMLILPGIDNSGFYYLVPYVGGVSGWIDLILGLLATVVVFAFLGRKYGRISEYTVSFYDNRDGGGDVGVTYIDLKSSKEKKISVKRLEPKPYEPLAVKGAKSTRYVIGTICSLKIFPKEEKCYLQLGFPSLDEMRKAYKDLGGKDSE
jgi:hypothetical protein